MRGLALAVALSTAALAFSGCKKTPPSLGDAGAATAGLTPDQAAQVLARVGDRTITLGDFAAALEHMDQFDRMRYEAPERRKELLKEMIDVMLLADEAREKGYDKDPVTQQEMREVLRDAYLKKAREGAPAPSDIPADEVSAYFDAHRADFRDPERRRLAVIVLPSAPAANATLEAAKKANAAQWGELVRAKSMEREAKANVPIDLAGDVGFVSPPGDTHAPENPRVPEEVRAAAFEIGAVGDVLPRAVPARGKFYLVRLTSKTDPHDRTLAESERMIRVKLAQEKIRAREAALLDELRKQYPVKIDEAALGQVGVTLPAADAGAAPPPGPGPRDVRPGP